MGEERNAVKLLVLMLSLSPSSLSSPLSSLTSYSRQNHYHHIRWNMPSYYLSRWNINMKNHFRQILNHVEMMLITNFERILIIKAEVVNIEAHSRQNMELVQMWDVRQREELWVWHTGDIDISPHLKYAGNGRPLFIEKWKLNGNVMMMRRSYIHSIEILEFGKFQSFPNIYI